MASQSGSRSRMATWEKDAAVNSTVPIFPTLASRSLSVHHYDVEQEIDNLRRGLFLARKDTHVALQKFNHALEAERKAQTTLAAAEDRRSELCESVITFF
jgi:hypothetical protein